MIGIELFAILSILIVFLVIVLVYLTRVNNRMETRLSDLQEQYRLQMEYLKIELGELFLPDLEITNEASEHTTATAKK